MKKNQIEKKSVIGGEANKTIVEHPGTGENIEVDLSKDDKRDYSSETVKNELTKLGIEAYEEHEVTNPVTGVKSIVKIERDGTPESKMILALANPKLTRDQKDNVLGLYLFERGKENASFLMDLFRSKGTHAKETKAFKSQVRFDLEQIVSVISKHLETRAYHLAEEFSYNPEAFRKLASEYIEFIKSVEEGEPKTVIAFLKNRGNVNPTPIESAMLRTAFDDFAEAHHMRDLVDNITKARERDNGKGIYIDSNGRPYTTDDPDITEAVTRDRERVAELNREE